MLFQTFVALPIAAALLAGAAQAQSAALPVSFTKTVNLPVVGVASTETAQVNVVNLAPSVQSVSAGGTVPTEGFIASCTGGITFYSASGNIITSSATFTIGTGQIFSATLPYSEIPAGGASARTPIRAAVTITGTNSATTPCSLASNIEVFDTATGVAHVHVEGNTLGLPGLIGIPLPALAR
jgi:hypothetical protein